MSGAVLERSAVLLGSHVPSDVLDELFRSTAWRRLNRLVVRSSRARRDPTAGVASGLIVSSARDAALPSLAALVRHFLAAGAVRVGRPALTDSGGRLAWSRRTPGEIDAQREEYLSWVDEQAAFTVSPRSRLTEHEASAV